MKPVHVVVLVLAGAIVGAVGLTVAQHARRPAPPPVVAQTPAPVAAPVTPTVPAAEPAAPQPAAAAPVAPPEATKPSPVASSQPASRPKAAPPARKKEPVEVARVTPPPPAQQAPAPAPAAAQPEPPRQVEPLPQSTRVEPPARPEPEPVAPAPPPPPNKVTLNAGTLIPVRLIDGLSSERSNPGDLFTATLDKELVVDGFVIAERGARAEGRVVSSERAGKVKGVAALSVELTSIHTSDGQKVALQTDAFQRQAEPTKGSDATKIGAGAAVGAIIGAIAGGGKGAAIGAGVGGGAGAADVLLTRGKPATLPSETRLSFRLREPITITERR